MENAEGIKGFEQWERYVRENEARLAGQEQDSRKHILIYASGETGEVVFHRDFQKDTETGPVHMHSNIEIGFVVRGCARQSFNGKEYRFRAGDFWITNPNCYHCDIYHLEELFTVYFSISLETFDSAILGFVENSEIQQFLRTSLMRQKMIRQFLHFTRKSNGGIAAQRILNQILQEIIEKKTGYEDVVKGLSAMTSWLRWKRRGGCGIFCIRKWSSICRSITTMPTLIILCRSSTIMKIITTG